MAGFSGRNHRSGKRAGGGSSFFSIASVVVFLAFCLLAVWIFSSSSSSVSSRVRQVVNSHQDSVPAFDDKPDESALTRSRRDEIRETETEEDTAEEKRREVEEEERKPEIEKDGEPERKPDAGESGKERETNLDGGDSKEQRQTEANLDGGESQQQEMSSNDGDSQQTETSTVGGESQTSSEGGDSQQSTQEEMETSEIRPRNEGESEEKKEPEVSQNEETSNNEGSEESPKQKDEPPQQSGEEKGPETNEAGSGSGSESSEEKKSVQKDGGSGGGSIVSHHWELCNASAGADYIPCLDNEKALKTVRITGHYEHRERHCPEEGPKCLVPLPNGYKHSIEWPTSRNKIWYNNVPHTTLAEVKGHQNWVKVTGDHLTFPGGGTQFIHGALHYIDFIQKAVPRIAWGKHTRVILDVGCGVASLGGYLFDRDVLTMSFAPKDEHTAQVQFALERGIPAISAVMGTQRLPYPSGVFDIVHCARCRVPWHVDGGRLLLELNRVLRPGGYFVWSATPVYQKLQEDVEIWKAMSTLTKAMCWDLITIKKDKINSVGVAIYRKPVSNDCYNNRNKQEPPMCKEEDDANASWYVPLQSCLHKVPVHTNQRGTMWPADWPKRLQTPPYWLNNTEMGIYGKPAANDFTADLEHWKRVVNKSYLNGMDINWAKVRNVMDMKAVYGGFAAAMKDLSIWVMNVVNIDSQDTLPIIYERGLFGIYHDWCESFSTYPRTYDLLHADHLFSGLKKRCDILPVIVEVDRIVRPGGKVIIRDEPSTVSEVENLLKSLHWDVRLTFTQGNEGILCAEKSDWRPETFSSSS